MHFARERRRKTNFPAKSLASLGKIYYVIGNLKEFPIT